jgi:hypothetical protein
MPKKKRKRAPKPETVRFQVSIRTRLKLERVEQARALFEAWLETGEAPSAEVMVHIWQRDHERTVESIGDDPRGESLRETLRRALHDGHLQIRKVRADRRANPE